MGEISNLGRSYLRDFVTDGVPASGPNKAKKSEGRAAFDAIDAALADVASGITVGNAVNYATQSALFADLAHVAGTLGVVYNDSDATKNGIYRKSGSSGSGSWTLTDLALPSTFAADLATLAADVDAKADDDAVVKLSGNQTVAGTKTFSSAPTVPDASFAIAKVSGLQTALNAKADDDAIVKLTGDQTVAGTKTFALAPSVPDASFAIAKVNGLQTALNDKADDADVAAEATRRAAGDNVAKRIADVGIAATQVIGLSGDPTTGTAFGANTYVMAYPTIDDGYLARIKVFALNAGTFSLRTFSKSGNTFTQVNSYTVTVASGLNTLTPSDYGYIQLAKNRYIGFYNTSGNKFCYVGGGITTRHWFSGTGDVTSFDDSSVDVNNDIQVSFEVAYAAVNDARVSNTEAALAAVKSAVSVKQTQILGVPTTPEEAGGTVGGTYAFADAAEADGYITKIHFWSTAATTVPIYVWRKVGSDFIAVSKTVVTAEAGLNQLDSALGDFDPIPIKAGQYGGYYSDTNINYYGSGVPYSGGWYRTNANVDVLANPTLTTGSGARLQLGLIIDYDEPVSIGVIDASLPVATDGSTLHRLRAKLGTKLNGGSSTLRVGFMGDSWTERAAIVNAFKGLVTTAYGSTGYGWISCDDVTNLSGLTHDQSGWTLWDATSSPPDPEIGAALDGKAAYATGTSATVTITVQCETFKIAYLNGSGTFRHRVDGGSWTTVTGTGGGGVSWATRSGMSDASHTIEIDLTGNSGTVVLYGYIARRSAAGVEVNKIGNSGIDGSQIVPYLDQMEPFFDELDLDVLVIILGTNDYRRSVAFSTYTAALAGMIQSAREAVPGCGIILWGPADSDGTVVTPLIEYVEEMHRLSIVSGVEFFNQNKMFGPYAETNALGLWDDDVHLSNNGAYVGCKDLVRRFFWL